MDSSAISFNVVFVRGTVRYLRSFVHSLRHHSRDVHFRLVANGCSNTERGMLRDLCRNDDGLSLLDLTRIRRLTHGAALNELQRREASPYFAIMDSDCVATGDFASRLASELAGAAAVFSGAPVWSAGLPHRLGKGFQRLECPYRELFDGQCAGGTYVALYDNAILSECMRETGVSFHAYHWREIPSSVQQELSAAGKKLAWYDTGRLLTILLGMRGHRCNFVDLPSLIHLGGISAIPTWRLRRALLTGLEALKLRTPLRGLRERFMGGDAPDIDAIEAGQCRLISDRKECVSSYFWELLRSLEGTRLAAPRFQHPDDGLRSAVASAESRIRDAYAASMSGSRYRTG